MKKLSTLDVNFFYFKCDTIKFLKCIKYFDFKCLKIDVICAWGILPMSVCIYVYVCFFNTFYSYRE